MPSNLSIKILGDCDQGVIDQFEFYSGETRTLKFQIYDEENDQRYCVPTTATKTVTLPSTQAADITIINANITQDANDASIFSVSLTAIDTANLMTGWCRFQFVTAGPTPITRIAFKELVLKKLTT